MKKIFLTILTILSVLSVSAQTPDVKLLNVSGAPASDTIHLKGSVSGVVTEWGFQYRLSGTYLWTTTGYTGAFEADIVNLPNGKYDFRAWARNGIGESFYSKTQSYVLSLCCDLSGGGVVIYPSTVPPVTAACGPLPTMDMVFVKGGTFTMGCTAGQGGDCSPNESPAHQVAVSDFYMGKFEVTQGQWYAVMCDTPSYRRNDNFPIENINWSDVQTFLSKLNALTGKNYRLPTEAEWEYAARGGQLSHDYKYSGSNVVGDVAVYGNLEYPKVYHTVGSKAPNELGIYDMSGNVYEWCQDSWDGSNNYGSTPTNGSANTTGTYRVIRGGDWDNLAKEVRVSHRSYSNPTLGGGAALGAPFIGFRVAFSVAP